ncbi:MAG: hypothetical protein J6X25_07670 [Bacteroidales bacterium]|jgi:hypothetical protein|nr:hypothetical protein [Bacteroidales bacterium]
MRIKYFFIYIAVGVAFLAVSLWVILTAGKNAKAIGAKYKLGGLMLTTWAMLSACTCNGTGPGVVTCYDPVPPEQPMCYDVVAPVNQLSLVGDLSIKRGEVVTIRVDSPTYETYLLQVKDSEDKVLQEERSALYKENEESYDQFIRMTLSKSLPAGDVKLVVSGLYKEEGQEEESAESLYAFDITLL